MTDQAGRVVLVTGSNTGIGRVTAEELARRGARVYLACRSEEKTRPVIDAIKAAGGDARFLELDLGDLASVRACARAFLAESHE
jgi:NAD(P)-dependent dehydrogenase (short-subunit alcohol dehydrogenase family)